MNFSLATIILFLFGFSSGVPQSEVFKWAEGLCEFEGTFDSSKYSQAQIRDTHKLVSKVGSIPLFSDVTVRRIKELGTLDTKDLNLEYDKALKKLKGLNIVKSEYWESLRKKKIDELEQYYRLAKVTIEGYRNPSALKQFTRAQECVDFYAQPLITGGEYLYVTWHKVNMDSRHRNSSPSRLKSVFERQNASADRLKYARIEVMSFGWWNCALRSIDMVEDSEGVQKQFRKLFKKVKEDCDDEP